MEKKENKENKVIPYIYPTSYHMSEFENAFGNDPFISRIGVMGDAMENTLLDEKEPWLV